MKVLWSTGLDPIDPLVSCMYCVLILGNIDVCPKTLLGMDQLATEFIAIT